MEPVQTALIRPLVKRNSVQGYRYSRLHVFITGKLHNAQARANFALNTEYSGEYVNNFNNLLLNPFVFSRMKARFRREKGWDSATAHCFTQLRLLDC